MYSIKDYAIQKLAEVLGLPSEDMTFEENGLAVALWACARVARLKSENVKMKEVLEFYANLDNYFITDANHDFNDPTVIDTDGGKMARKILKELKYERS